LTDPNPFMRWLTTMGKAFRCPRDSDLARALQVPQSTIHRWRSGSRPTVEHLARVGRLFGTGIEPLLVLAGYIPAGDYERPVSELSLTEQALDAANRRNAELEQLLAELRAELTAARGAEREELR
jgi:transcriptional regulator with XRE-family HTH domain